MSGEDEETRKQREAFQGITAKVEALLLTQERLESRFQDSSHESKEFLTILTRLQSDAATEASKIADKLMESVATKHRMEREVSSALVEQLKGKAMELESCLNDCRAEKEELEAELMDKNAEYETALMRESNLSEAHMTLEANIEALRQQHETFLAERTQQDEISSGGLHQQLEARKKLEAELQELQQERTTLQGTIRQHIAELEDRAKRIQESEAGVKGLQEELATLRVDVQASQESAHKQFDFFLSLLFLSISFSFILNLPRHALS